MPAPTRADFFPSSPSLPAAVSPRGRTDVRHPV